MQDVQTATVDLEEVRAYRSDFRSRCVQVKFVYPFTNTVRINLLMYVQSCTCAT